MFAPFNRVFSFCIVFALMIFFSSAPIPAQDDKKPDGAAPKTKAKKDAPMKGQDRELEGDWFMTKEQHPVKISATYYYGNADKETVPVLLFHDANGNRNDFRPLISRLTSAGYAVLAPDFRGHGKSIKRYEITPPKYEMKEFTKQRKNAGRNQKPKTYTEEVLVAPATKKLVDYLAADFQPDDFLAIVRSDLPLFRHTLENVHIEGMVNMNRLVVVGIGRGAAVAAYWAMPDWEDRKSDRFTKTLVLIAPTEIDPRDDFAQRVFAGNKLIRDNVAVLCAVPAGDISSQNVANKVRAALLDKDAEGDKGGMESKFPIFTYPTEKTVKTDKGESKAPMTMAETFSSGESKLGEAVFEFIDKRNKGFEEKEARWSKLK